MLIALGTLVAVSGGALVDPPSRAAVQSRASLTLSTPRPIVDELFTASGRVSTRFSRPVLVRMQVGSAWRLVRRASTTSSGVYRVTGLSTAVPRRYSVLVPAVRRAGRLFTRVSTPVRRVAPVRQSGTLEVLPAVSQRGVDPAPADRARSTVIARFTPARPGRAVRLRQRTSTGGWLTASGATRQDAQGTAYFSGTTGTRPYRATTVARSGAAALTTPAVADTWVRRFTDEFGGTSLDAASWSNREGRAPSRTHASNDSRAVSVGGGTLRLQVKKDPAAPTTRYLNGQISTEGHYSLTYGMASARVRFPPGRGQHGSFWLQSPTYGRYPGRPDLGGAEIDAVEFFGRGYPAGGLATFAYFLDADRRNVKVGGVWARAADLIPTGDTWWNSYPVFSVRWTPNSYTFYVDGRVLFATDRAVSRTQEYLVLSLLTSDWELPRLDRATLPTTMTVDWVRTWQTGPDVG
jgi:beta-glucanase (GH16 family)